MFCYKHSGGQTTAGDGDRRRGGGFIPESVYGSSTPCCVNSFLLYDNSPDWFNRGGLDGGSV